MKFFERRSNGIVQLVCGVLALLVLGSSPARGATPVEACGTLITQPGHYFVPFDLDCVGTDPWGILIAAEDVSLDLRGHTLTGAEVVGQHGIFSNASSRVRIKNGTVRGFEFGILFAGADDSRVQEVTARENLRIGLVLFASSNNEVLGNLLVSNDGGGLVAVPGPPESVGNTIQDNVMSNNGFYGVYVESSRNTLRDNVLSLNGAAAGAVGGHGVWVVNSTGTTIQGNVMSENRRDGVLLVDSSRNTIRGNTASQNSWSGIAIVSTVSGSASDNLLQGNTALGNNQDGLPSGTADLVDYPECINRWKGNLFQTDWEGSTAGMGPGEGCIR